MPAAHKTPAPTPTDSGVGPGVVDPRGVDPRGVDPRGVDPRGVDPRGVDPADFRQALGCFATGVTVITTASPTNGRAGLTVNSFSSVSLDPPLVLWSLSLHAPSLPAFQGSPYFAVNVLAADQADLSTRFATPAEDKFAGISVTRGLGDTPLLDGATAHFECRSEFRYYGGDHVIIVGRVERFAYGDRPPLIYHRGRYAKLQAAR